MFQSNEQEWPLVSLRNEGETSLEDMQHYIATWERWLERKEPFGVLLNQQGEVQKISKEVAALSNNWHKEHKEQIAQYCVGMAMITNSSRLLFLYKPIAGQMVQKRMGCPGKVFTTEDEAKVWAAQQVTQKRASTSPS